MLASRAVRYSEHPPSAALAPFVRCLWTLEGDAADLAEPIQPILPDGCPELVIHLGDAFERMYPNGRIERQASVLLAGQLTEHLSIRPTGQVAVIGVRFHPDGAAGLLDVPQRDLVGLTMDVDALSPALFRSVRAVCGSTPSPADAVAGVQRCLEKRMDPSGPDPLMRYAVDAIQRHRGGVSIDALARRIGWTRRHLERRFQTIVGISPKRLARIARFQSAVRVLERLDVPKRSTRTALAAGYADQAHFVREFHELAGCAPGAHLLRNAELNGYFSRQFSSKNPEMTTSPVARSTE
jgi:AraC-like DNA-binding protein